MHAWSARTEPLAGNRCATYGIERHRIVQEPNPWQGIVVPLLAALVVTRPDHFLAHELC